MARSCIECGEALPDRRHVCDPDKRRMWQMVPDDSTKGKQAKPRKLCNGFSVAQDAAYRRGWRAIVQHEMRKMHAAGEKLDDGLKVYAGIPLKR